MPEIVECRAYLRVRPAQAWHCNQYEVQYADKNDENEGPEKHAHEKELASSSENVSRALGTDVSVCVS